MTDNDPPPESTKMPCGLETKVDCKSLRPDAFATAEALGYACRRGQFRFDVGTEGSGMRGKWRVGAACEQ
jgi:hypothetical protein